LHVAQRFEHLLETYRRPDGQRWTGQQLDEATGGVVTRSYVTNLRKGHIENPGYEKMRAIGKELREIRDLIWELLEVLPSDRLTPRLRKELQSVVQLLQ
jgi:predicted transcriptional regulator